MFSIIIEWAGMVLWWPEEGLDHSRTMLVKEIDYLDIDFRRSIVKFDPARFAKLFADNTYHYLLEVTRFVDFIRRVSLQPTTNELGLGIILHNIYQSIAELAMPVFLLFSMVALVDGLVQRDRRRWGGGRESSFVYHYVKKAALPLAVITWVVYLALPFSLHPSIIVLPFASLFAMTVAVTASTFKKYL